MNSSRYSSLYSLDSDAGPVRPRTINEEVGDIRVSLELVRTRLISQQNLVSREFEDRIRTVYDSIINDLNEVRKQVNTVGDTVASSSKYKSWMPVVPFRKSVLKSVYEIRKPARNLKTSRSVDFLDSKSNIREKRGIERSTSSLAGRNKLSSSTNSVHSKSGSRSHLPGYGCCFYGDNKTISHRSYRARYNFYRDPAHSWCSSRHGSRSTLDDEDRIDFDKGCMCGKVTDDWRVKVAQHMWDGWPMPGLEQDDVEKLRERFEKFEEFRRDTIDVHNEYRRLHVCPELLFSEELSRDAMQWAESLVVKGYAQYSDSASCGENILVVDIENELSGRQVVDTWYRENKHYNYRHPKWQRGTSNFTQMIWKGSQRVGVGIAKYPYHDTYIIVVRYQPPGNRNTPSQFTHNVPPPKHIEINEPDNIQYENIETICSTESSTTHHEDNISSKLQMIEIKDIDTEHRENDDSHGDTVNRLSNTTTKNSGMGEEKTTNIFNDSAFNLVHETETVDNVDKLPSTVYENIPTVTATHPETRLDTEYNVQDSLSNFNNSREFDRVLSKSNSTKVSDFSKEIYHLSVAKPAQEKYADVFLEEPDIPEECPYATIADFDRGRKTNETSGSAQSIDTRSEQKHQELLDDAGDDCSSNEQLGQVVTPKKLEPTEDLYATVVKGKLNRSNTYPKSDIDEYGYAKIPADDDTNTLNPVLNSEHRRNKHKQKFLRRKRTNTNTKRRPSTETDV